MVVGSGADVECYITEARGVNSISSSFCARQRCRCHLEAYCVLTFAVSMHQPDTRSYGSCVMDAAVRDLITGLAIYPADGFIMLILVTPARLV